MAGKSPIKGRLRRPAQGKVLGGGRVSNYPAIRMPASPRMSFGRMRGFGGKAPNEDALLASRLGAQWGAETKAAQLGASTEKLSVLDEQLQAIDETVRAMLETIQTGGPRDAEPLQ